MKHAGDPSDKPGELAGPVADVAQIAGWPEPRLQASLKCQHHAVGGRRQRKHELGGRQSEEMPDQAVPVLHQDRWNWWRVNLPATHKTVGNCKGPAGEHSLPAET